MKKILLIFLFVILLPGLGLFFYFNQVSTKDMSAKEKTQAEKNLLGRAIKVERTNQIVSHTDPYVSFSYPAWLSVDTRDQTVPTKNPTVLDLFELRDAETHLFIVTQVQTTSSASLSEESAVKLRQTQSDLYSEASITLDGKQALLFTKKQNGAEKSIFLLLNHRLYTIAATAESMLRIDDVLPEILKTLRIN